MKYVDMYSHIVQADGDGGDSLNRIGCYFSCANYTLDDLEIYADAMYYNRQDNRYCRNPHPDKWYSNRNNTTRDQMIPLEAAWAIMTQISIARAHFKLRLKRFMFHFNTEDNGYDSGLPLRKTFPDAPTPTELAVAIRAARFSILRPLLYVLDLALIVEVTILRSRGGYDYDNQLLPAMIAALKVWPTFIGRIAKRLYAKTDAPERLKIYYQEGQYYNGIEPLGQVMINAFKEKIQSA